MSEMTTGMGFQVLRRNLPRVALPGWTYLLGVYLVAGLVAVATAWIDNPLLLLLGAIAIPVAAAIFVKPELGLALLLFVTFTRAFEVVFGEDTGGLSPYTVYLGFLLLVLAVRWFFLGEKIAGWQTTVTLYGIFGLLILASLLYADYPDETWFQFVIFVKDFAMLLLVVVLTRKSGDLRLAVWSLLAAGIFLGTITLYQQLTGSFDNTFFGFGEVKIANIIDKVQGARIGGPGLDPNLYSQFMLVLVPLAWERLWGETKPLLRALAGWAFLVTVLAIVFTFSRGNFLGLVVVLGLLLVLRPPTLVGFVVGAVVVGLMLPFIPRDYFQRINTLTSVITQVGSSDDELAGVQRAAASEISFRGRLSENLVGLLMTRDHPIIGVGYANFKSHYQTYSRTLGLDPRREGRSAHNLYLELSAELGIIGLLWFAALNAIVFFGLIRARQDFLILSMPGYAAIATAVAISIAGLLITSIFLHLVYPRYFWLIYAVALAIPNIASYELDRSFIDSGWKQFQRENSTGIGYAE